MLKMLLMLAGVIISALSSCSKQKAPPFLGEQSVLVFNGGLGIEKANQSFSSTKTITNGPLDANTNIGIYVRTIVAGSEYVPATTIETTRLNNILFTPGDNNAIESDQHIILHMGASRYGVYAYSPRNTTASPLNGRKIPVHHGADILWARNIGTDNGGFPATEGGTSVSLVFEHRGSQVKFQLIDVTDGKTLDFSNATLTISGFAETGTLNVEDGELTLHAERTQILTYSDFTAKATKATDPTDILVDNAEVTISVTLSGVLDDKNITVDDFKGTHPSILTSGTSYLYKFNVGSGVSDNTIDIVCDVANWTTVSADLDAT